MHKCKCNDYNHASISLSLSTTFIHWARSQSLKRMSAAKRLNTERSFRVVVRLCARENTHSHTGLTHMLSHIYKNNVYKGLHNFYWSLHDYFISLYYLVPLFLSWFLQTSWSYLTQMYEFLSEQTRTFCLFRWTQSLHQSDTSQQSSCWHWKGECWFERDQRCHLIRFIMLLWFKWNQSMHKVKLKVFSKYLLSFSRVTSLIL